MSFLFIATSIGVIAPILVTTFVPTPIQKDAAFDAKNRNWNIVQIYVTRALGFLTLFTQFMVCVFLYDVTNILALLIAQTFSFSVFILYHGINAIDPLHLAYHPKELVYEVVRWRPPFSKMIFLWGGLHYQHTFFPFYLKYYQYSENIVFTEHVNVTDGLFLSWILLSFYITWHAHCWRVQGYPAYPFLSQLRREGLESTFYGLGFAVFCLVYVTLWYL